MPPGHGLQGITARREIRSINHTAWRNATKQPFVRTCAVRRRRGLFIQPARHGQGAARYCSWCRQSSSGHPKEPPSPEPALTAAVNSGESAGAFCAPIATPHAEPPLNGVYGLSRVTQGLSERAASALKGLWPSGAWWQRPRTKAKRAGSTQQSILASAVVVPRNIVHAAVANNQCPASTTRGRKSPQGKTG